mmetsp:Transcript_2903/g.7530  ORF Transcript_2903/g.7530 Transcript_2903/m.7530 type:complete len:210 (+) Transcript_2903:744-1373(+)
MLLNYVLHNEQAETGAPVLVSRRTDEHFSAGGGCCGVHSSARVSHAHVQPTRPVAEVRKLGGQGDGPLFRELEGVGDEVHDHTEETWCIDDDVRDVLGQVGDEGDVRVANHPQKTHQFAQLSTKIGRHVVGDDVPMLYLVDLEHVTHDHVHHGHRRLSQRNALCKALWPHIETRRQDLQRHAEVMRRTQQEPEQRPSLSLCYVRVDLFL